MLSNRVPHLERHTQRLHSQRRMGLATPPAWVAAVLLLGAWLLLRTAVSSAIPGQAANAAREVAITYVARVEATRQAAGEMQLWVPLAKTRQGQQEVLAREVHAPAPYTVAEDPEFGNGILHLTFHRPVQAGLIWAATCSNEGAR